jgi:acetolactate synthase-1/2/3 large subunit
MTGRALTGGGLLLKSLKKSGFDVFFLNSGTEYASLLLDYRLLEKAERPEMVVCLHEATAVSAAYGYAVASGSLSAVLVHTTPGVANALNNIINAQKAHIPVLLISGITPFTQSGHQGSKNLRVHWGQETRNIEQLVEQFVKWSYVVKYVAEIPEAVARAAEVMSAEPQGPAYIGIHREWLMEKAVESQSFPVSTFSISPAPHPEVIKDIASHFVASEYPVVLTHAAGRDRENVRLLVGLASLTGCRVNYALGDYVNFPTTNPFSSPADLSKADFILVIEADVPWIPARHKVREEAYKVVVGTDPLRINYNLWGFRFNVAVTSKASTFLKMLVEELRNIRAVNADVLESRRSKAFEEWGSLREKREEEVNDDFKRGVLTKRLASYLVGKAAPSDAVLLNEYSLNPKYIDREVPGTYFWEPPAGGLGWGLGAAHGVKMAHPSSFVIAVVGDGSFVFNNPVSAYALGRWYELPVLTIVFNDGCWGDVKKSVLDTGIYKSIDEIGFLEGADFYERLDVAKIGEACGLKAYKAAEPSEALNKIKEAVETVRQGIPAIVDLQVSVT